MRKLRAISAILFVSVLALPLFSQVGAPANRDVTVMTRNLYLGTDLTPVIVSPDPVTAEAVFANVFTTDYPARAVALADEIDATRPALIGLQEAVIWRTQTPGDLLLGVFAPNATDVVFDLLQSLLDELAIRGLHYAPVVIGMGLDVEVPGFGRDIRLTDREVILARTDLKVAEMKLSNPQAALFTNVLAVPGPLGPLQVLRGWASIDMKVRGKTFRFVTSHLEVIEPNVQLAQANELLQGPASTSLPVVLLGDFNSAASGTGTASYGQIVGAGFVDTWSAVNPLDPGFTCCQNELLDNAVSTLFERIDIVFIRGRIDTLAAERVGHLPVALGPNLHWASDHAGVTATLRILP